MYLNRSISSVWVFIITTGFALTALNGCDGLSKKKPLGDLEYSLLDQDSSSVVFPEEYSGKVMLVGYVYTHCPDICPIITYNMRDIQEAISDNDPFMLVSISFDPERDSPEILKDYAQNYRVDQTNWTFLTGKKTDIDSLLLDLEISTLKSPTRFTDDNEPIYFIDHSDKVTLIDKDGFIRKTYVGSELNSEEAIQDIKLLLEEM